MTCAASLTATFDDSLQECRSKRPALLPSGPEEFTLTGDSSITQACGLWLFQHDWQDIPLARTGVRVA